MRYIVVILILLLHLEGNATRFKQSNMSSVEIVNDTVFANGKVYCLLFFDGEAHYISTPDVQQVVYLKPVKSNNTSYIQVSFTPLNRKYYIQSKGTYVNTLIHELVKYDVIEDGYFSAYGAQLLINANIESGKYIEEWDLPKDMPAMKTLNWNISWKETPNKDSTLILADGQAFAYYTYRNWRDYGVSKYEVAIETNSDYRYFIHDLHTDSLMAEVRVADGWKTEIKVITPDDNTYTLEYVPNNKDFMTIIAKLLLTKQTIGKN